MKLFACMLEVLLNMVAARELVTSVAIFRRAAEKHN